MKSFSPIIPNRSHRSVGFFYISPLCSVQVLSFDSPSHSHNLQSSVDVLYIVSCRQTAIWRLQRLHHQRVGRPKGDPRIHFVRAREQSQYPSRLSRRDSVLLGVLGPHFTGKDSHCARIGLKFRLLSKVKRILRPKCCSCYCYNKRVTFLYKNSILFVIYLANFQAVFTLFLCPCRSGLEQQLALPARFSPALTSTATFTRTTINLTCWVHKKCTVE